MSKETEAAITNPFYCGNNGELYYAHEDKKNRVAASKPDELSKQQKIGQLNMHSVVCSACGELIPDHEKYPAMNQMNIDEIECIGCEMLARDSADLDNSFGAS